ncbi:MAG: S-methyl-5-thioribose-1-phosphate isomerase, partial [Lachnospiraceae bacterium]|nr:S-methyl-5-thioribose-1-phosphate isomerase [Lachnospiraceae bacterium]
MSTIRDSMTKDTVYLGEGPAVVLIDQTLLPNEVKWLHLTERKEMWEAIYLLKVRGAPAIGVAAAIGMYVLAAHYEEADREAFVARFKEDAAYLNSSRPTAVNLSWGLKRMQGTLDRILGSGAALSGESERGRGEGLLKPDESDWREEVLGALRREAQAIHDEDIEVCRRIGENGLPLLKDGDGVLTHCNAGKLATIQYGTATAPLYLANERGMRLRVYCDETRPLLQGARLTAFELSASGIDTTLLCDNMSASLMRQGKVNSVFVGCDRVAANGDVANKIGTYGLAVLARE